MKNELILAVPTKDVWQILEYNENAVIRAQCTGVMDNLLLHGVFGMRPILEEKPEYKQIIPYAVICCGEDVYLFHRTKKQSEKRLHNLYSLGVGGHMNPFGNIIDREYLHHELEREMNEEVIVHESCKVEQIVPVGFINDDTNEVGKVHLGVLYEIELSNTDIEINEKDKMTGVWIKKSELRDYYPQMESWSKIYCDLINK